MDNKKIIKLIIAILLFILGTLASIFLSSYLHLVLTKDIKIIGLMEAFTIIKLNKKARNLFLLFELSAIALSIFYYFMKDSFYESELIEITPDIKIPKPAGQMQFGSAWFATDEEKERTFTICEIDNRIKKLINKKQAENMDIENEVNDENVKIKYSILKGRWTSSRDR